MCYFCPAVLATCGVSKNLWQRSQADTDSWHGLFDTQADPVEGVFSLSHKRADTVGEPLFWFLIVQKKVLKGGDAGEYFVIGGYEGSSCLWHETDEGFGYQCTTKNIFVVQACLESTPGMAVLLGSRLW